MIKNYFLTYGYTGTNKDELREIISEELNITFHEISAGNFAYRFGDLAESISISDHYEEEDDWWEFPDYQHCTILLTISVTRGKNVDKEAKINFLKTKLSMIQNLIEIKSSIIES